MDEMAEMRPRAKGATIRSATPADAPSLGTIHVAAWRETYRGLIPSALIKSHTIKSRSQMWGRILHDPAKNGTVAVFVAEIGGSAVGFASCGNQQDPELWSAGFTGEINSIYVLKAFQRAGAGRLLINRLAQALSAAGHHGASLWVLKGNAPARAFYEALGGSLVGERLDERPQAALDEVGYGWRDLTVLRELAGGPR